MTTVRALLGLTIAMALAPGCGGDDGKAGEATYSSGLDQSKAVRDLTDTEGAALCQRSRAFMHGKVAISNDELCRFSGLWEVTVRTTSFHRSPVRRALMSLADT